MSIQSKQQIRDTDSEFGLPSGVSPEFPVTLDEARSILQPGACLSFGEAARAFGDDRIPRVVPPIPFSRHDLVSHRLTHLLVAVLPTSIADLQQRAPSGVFGWQPQARSWWMRSPVVSQEWTRTEWLLFRRSVFRPSMDLAGQLNGLALNEFVPRACEIVYTSVLWYLTSGQRLYEGQLARSADASRPQHRVLVGGFSTRGVLLSACHDFTRVHCVGLATARRK